MNLLRESEGLREGLSSTFRPVWPTKGDDTENFTPISKRIVLVKEGILTDLRLATPLK